MTTSESGKAKTFLIERIHCKIVNFATKVHKTVLSRPIQMKERIWFMFGKICIYIAKHFLSMIWTFFRLLGHFLDHPDTLHIIRTFFRSLGPFSDHRDTFQIIRIVKTLFISSKHFSGYFADHMDTFHIIRTLFR